ACRDRARKSLPGIQRFTGSACRIATDASTYRCRRRDAQITSQTRHRSGVAIPVLHDAVRTLQESKQTAVGAITQLMAARLDRIADFEIVARDADFVQTVAARRFEHPCLGLRAFLDVDIHV